MEDGDAGYVEDVERGVLKLRLEIKIPDITGDSIE